TIVLHTLLLFCFTLLPRPKFTLFPYTTLFRSRSRFRKDLWESRSETISWDHRRCNRTGSWRFAGRRECRDPCSYPDNYMGLDIRSEEHTSELQSREKLVCRLLLEKKKKVRKRS